MLNPSAGHGDLVLDTEASTPVVLITGGIGVTPIIGMRSYLAATNSDRQVLSLHRDRMPETDALGERRAELVAQLLDG